jgi:SAM-dependent methyltransferase
MQTDNPAGQAEHTRQTREAYDRLAAVWSATTDDGSYNGLLERPAVRALVPPDLDGAAVLEAGCGSGSQAEWLLDQGAEVIGIDLSPRMVREAAHRCAGRGRFFVADLSQPLPLEPRSLDGVTCSLALHYVRDLAVPLRSFAAALRPGGWAVISLDHPFGPPTPAQRGGYFDTERASRLS